MKLIQRIATTAVFAALVALAVGALPAAALADEPVAPAPSVAVISAEALMADMDQLRTQLLSNTSAKSVLQTEDAIGVYKDLSDGGTIQKKRVPVETGTVAKLKGTFAFTLRGTALQVANVDDSMEPGVQMFLSASRDLPARFYVQRVSKTSPWCYIRNASSGRALAAKDGKVVQAKTTKKADQQWKILKMKDGSFVIESRSTGKRMGAALSKSGSGLILQNPTNTKMQRFIISKAKAAYMLTRERMIGIINQASGKRSLKMVNCTYDIPAKAKSYLLDEMQNTKDIAGLYGFLLVDLRTGEGFCYDSDVSIYSASSLKGPYLVAINKYQPKQARAYRDWYYSLIHDSSNETYSYLRGAFGSESFKKYLKYADVHDLDYQEEYQFVQVKSMAKLWVCNWEYFNGGTANAKNIRGLYKYINGSEICTVLGYRPGYTTYSKGGWVTDAGICTSYNSIGIVIRPDGTRYLLSVLTMLNPETWEEAQMRSLVAAIDSAYGAISKNS